MVNTKHIIALRRLFHALYPPLVAVLLHLVPVVERVAPELTRRREIVRRHTRNAARVSSLVKLKQLGLRPDVGAVGRNVYRNVADNAYSVLVAVAPERVPLMEKQILNKLYVVDFLAQLVGVALNCFGVAQLYVIVPKRPRLARELPFKRGEKRVVVKPIRLLADECGVAYIVLKRSKSLAQKRVARFRNLVVVNI